MPHKSKSLAHSDPICQNGIPLHPKKIEWKEYKLGEVANLSTRKMPISEVVSDNYISTENMIENKGGVKQASSIPGTGNATKYSVGDILISNIRPYFKKIWMANRNGGCSNDVLCLVPNEELVNRKYLYYTLCQDVFFDYVMLGSKGCKMPRGDKSHIMNWRFVFPPLSEQKRIASILSSLDDKIDLLHRQNATLEAMAETLFRHHFIENPNPEWKEGTISDVVEFNPLRKIPKGAKAPFLEMSNLSTDTYAPKGWYEREFSSGSKFINGDTLLARITPCLENGKTAYVDFLGSGQVGWGSTEYIVMRPKGMIHPFFAYVVARNQDFRDHAKSCMVGSSGRQRVDVDNLKLYGFRIPDTKFVEVFNKLLISLEKKMSHNNSEIRNLNSLLLSLLFRLIPNGGRL